MKHKNKNKDPKSQSLIYLDNNHLLIISRLYKWKNKDFQKSKQNQNDF